MKSTELFLLPPFYYPHSVHVRMVNSVRCKELGSWTGISLLRWNRPPQPKLVPGKRWGNKKVHIPILTGHVGEDVVREGPVQLGTDGGAVPEAEVDLLPALHGGHSSEGTADAAAAVPVL